MSCLDELRDKIVTLTKNSQSSVNNQRLRLTVSLATTTNIRSAYKFSVFF